MHGHHPNKPRHNTAPSRLRKRDVPAVWDLFALDDRAHASARDDDDASSVASLSHPPSIASLGSFASEDTQQSDGIHVNPPFVALSGSGGSWPRIRKQRTSEMGGSMSLFEVAEALGADESSADADLASLAKLVAEEEQEMVNSTPADGSAEASNVSIESFVDAVFKGIAPGSTASAQASTSSAAATHAATSAEPAAPNKPPSRPHTANELALLEALKQDQAAQEAMKGGSSNVPAVQRRNTSSPTFAALAGELDLAGDAHEHAEASDDVFAMLDLLPPGHSSPALNPHQQIDQSLPSGASTDHASRSDPYAYPHGPPPSFAEYDFGEGMPPLRPQAGNASSSSSSTAHPPYTTRPTPHHPGGPSSSHYDESYPGWYEPLHHGGPHGPHHSSSSISKAASAPVLFGNLDTHDDVHLPASVSAEQLAGHLDHALGVPLDALEKQINAADSASRANTIRAQEHSRRHSKQGSSSQRLPAKYIHQQPPPGYPAGLAPPPHHHHHHQHPHHPHHPHHSPPLPPYLETGPPPTAHLDAEALANIPTAPIQPLGPSHNHAGMPIASAHPHHPHHPGHHPLSVHSHHLSAAAASMQGVVGMSPAQQHAHAAAAHAAAAAAIRDQPMASAAGRNGAERKEWTVHEDEIIRQSVLAHGCRWRRIAAQLPGRSDDAVRNRWNRLKEMGIGESTPHPHNQGGRDGGDMDISDAEAAAQAPFALPPTALPLPDGMAPSDLSLPPHPPSASKLPKQATPPGKGGVAAASSTSHAGAQDGGSSKETQSRVSWTKNEDETILRGVAELGHKWNKIAERLPGRTDHAIRNRFHRLQTLLEDRQRQQQRVLAPNLPLPLPPMAPNHQLHMQPHLNPHAQALTLPDPHGLVTTVGGVHALLQQTVDGLPTPQSAASGESGGYETPVGSSTSPTTKA